MSSFWFDLSRNTLGIVHSEPHATPQAKSRQSDPHPPGTPRFLNWFHPATLYARFCSNDPSFSGIQQPPPSFSNRQTGGVYIIFPAASPTAQWAVHRSISRSVHPWLDLQPQRSSRRLNRGLAFCHQRLTAYELLMRAWGGLCTRVNVGCR